MYWATDPITRFKLRHSAPAHLQQVQQVSDVKDLGTHLSFDRCFHAKTVQQREAEAMERLTVLSRSSLPRDAKAQAISQSIFPMLFYQPGLHKFSLHMLDEISTKITEVLGVNAHGRSKPHALALFPKADPYRYLHVQRIKLMREFLLRHPQPFGFIDPNAVLQQGVVCLFFESTQFLDWVHICDLELML
jgi:hypothetical protein